MRALSRPSAVMIGLVVMALLAASVGFGIGGLSRKTTAEQVLLAEQMIRRAAIQCYALEGVYPSDLDYLAAHYGVMVDRNRYFYHYEAFAANILPIIKVLKK